MQAPPLSVIEAWPEPNYVNPQTRGNLKVILNVVLYSILICFVGLRVFTRTYLRKNFGGDDVLILLAVVSSLYREVMSMDGESRSRREERREGLGKRELNTDGIWG
jgi:hypothetical protein